MKNKLLNLLTLSFIAVSFVSCFESDTENAIEDIGEKIEETTEDSRDGMEDAIDEAKDGMEETVEEAKDEMDDATN